jgi:hypothetical protein
MSHQDLRQKKFEKIAAHRIFSNSWGSWANNTNMGQYFVDTSPLVKRYRAEQGTDRASNCPLCELRALA